MRTINDGFPIKQFNGIDINTSTLSSPANYYTYSSRVVKFIVIHYTGNKKDTAKNNATFFHNGARDSSANYFMDEAECYQSVALNNAAWAVGGTKVYKHAECRNINSISIEMCCSGNSIVSEKTINNTAYLCAELCKYIGITADTVDIFVLRHYDVWDKQCPAQWATENSAGWTTFKEKVKAILRNEEGLTMEQYNELKELINKQAAEIADLKNINKQLVNVVQTTMVYDFNDDNMPSWARPAVQAAMDCGAIQGDEDGCLGLSYKDLRAIVREYRCGLYNK
ncbi:N-acetylmuramoyl-L-alanine amidase family protein [Hominilimicola sp.]|uniref:peptidoglycan recognition protein family protein n=1 Tax=Hominilimicola sp. TaxID=3073571 RepID=UPI0039968C9B